MPHIGVEYPLEVTLPSGNVVYRAVLGINEDGSLIFAGHVPEKTKVKISAPAGIPLLMRLKIVLRSLLVNIQILSQKLLYFSLVLQENMF